MRNHHNGDFGMNVTWTIVFNIKHFSIGQVLNHSLDLSNDMGSTQIPIEIKASKTYHSALKSSLSSWMNLKGNTSKKGYVIYRGKEIVGRKSEVTFTPWWNL